MAERLKRIGTHIGRYGLVIVLLWIGGMKFTIYEPEGIKPLVANSPLMGWVYKLTSVGGFSTFLGVVEIGKYPKVSLRLRRYYRRNGLGAMRLLVVRP
jgi:uncharacterized membrane protein YkgB